METSKLQLKKTELDFYYQICWKAANGRSGGVKAFYTGDFGILLGYSMSEHSEVVDLLRTLPFLEENMYYADENKIQEDPEFNFMRWRIVK